MAKKMRWPKPSKSLNIPLYHGTLYMYRSEEDFNRACDYLGTEKLEGIYSGMALHFVNEEGESVYLVGWFNDDVSTLVHEICHITMFVMKHVGIDPRDSGGEAFCYLTGHLFKELFGERKQPHTPALAA